VGDLAGGLPGPGGVQQILLVDEDAGTNARLVAACAGLARVRQVGTGAAAMRALDESDADLVILEQRLADTSGLALLAAIKGRRPWLPVIVATAYGSERVCAAALKAGARDYFIKPWEPAEMLRSVRALLTATVGGRRSSRQNVLPPVRPPAAGPVAPDRIEAAIREAARAIREQGEDSDSFGQLARTLGLSSSALSRRFKRTVHVSYRRFVLQSRIERARTLLGHSGLTITEVAQAVGFGDLPRFDKVFKAAVGTAPSLYRRRQSGSTL
jgi:AraC-like DNA-binding protein/CheY-like chemotaxis protein